MTTFFSDRYFSEFYFGGGYWQEVDQAGAISAALAGASSVTATATAVSVVQQGGGGSRRRAQNWEYARPFRQDAIPAPISSAIRSASAITATLTASASMAAAVESGSSVSAEGEAVDLFIAADNSFWLMAA